MTAKRVAGAGVLVLLAVVLGYLALRGNDSGNGGRASPEPASAEAGAEESEAEAEGEGEGARAEGTEEFEEEAEETAERIEAFQQAKAAGKFGGKAVATTSPTAGWVGSRIMNAPTDDWEPAVATDPSAPYAYLLTTRYGVDPPGCDQHCPSPFIAMTISSDNGATWGAQKPICLCLGAKAQYDPTIEVVPNTGAVYSAFLLGDRHKGFSTVFTKSTNHGKTWTTPVHVYGNVSWTDKPEITMSASGKDVYVSWNGPQGGDLYVGQSHDYGATWTQQKLSDDKRYYYAYDARVLAGGTVIFLREQHRLLGPEERRGREPDLAPRGHLPRQRRNLAERRRCEGRQRRGVCGGRLRPGLLHGPDVGGLRRVGASRLRVRRRDGRWRPAAGLHLPLLGRWANVDRRTARVRQRGECDRPAPRIVGWRQCAHVVHADVRG